MTSREYYVYIMTSQHNKVLYTGVTGNLKLRVWEHKKGKGSKFTKEYNINKLLYLETYNDINEAIKREKQIKAGSRADKIKLINRFNPQWNDLGLKNFY